MTQTMINGALCIELAIIFALAWIAWRAVKRARRAETEARRLDKMACEEMRIAHYWRGDAAALQAELDCVAPDAIKWRSARAARRKSDKARTQPQATLKAQTTAALRKGG